MNRKIPAFTLMEVTVAMLISAIAIAITYTASHIISVTYADYRTKQDKVAAFTVLDALLKKDFHLPGQVFRSADGVEIRTTEGTLRYYFADGYILRDQYALQTDTFKIIAKDLNFSFEKQGVAIGEPIDQLDLQVELEGVSLPLLYKKIYSSQDLFN